MLTDASGLNGYELEKAYRSIGSAIHYYGDTFSHTELVPNGKYEYIKTNDGKIIQLESCDERGFHPGLGHFSLLPNCGKEIDYPNYSRWSQAKYATYVRGLFAALGGEKSGNKEMVEGWISESRKWENDHAVAKDQAMATLRNSYGYSFDFTPANDSEENPAIPIRPAGLLPGFSRDDARAAFEKQRSWTKE
jgi:hypothetical protein